MCERELLTGKNPNTIAGTVIYLVTEFTPSPYSFSEISKVSGMVEGTIRQNFKRIESCRSDLVPGWFLAAQNLPNKK